MPTEALQPGDMELPSRYPGATAESSTSIEPITIPATEIQNGLENVEEFPLPSAAPIFTHSDALFLVEEQPNAEPIYIVAEMDAASPVSRGVSEGIEIAYFAGEVPDLDGEYMVEEPSTIEASVVGLTSKSLSFSELCILHRCQRMK